MSKQVRNWLVCGLALAAIGVAPGTGSAEKREARLAVIVVLDDSTDFRAYEREFVPDERAQAEPQAWDYLDRGIAGAVQSMEARAGFKARHVYSHAIRGFAARLTPTQIGQLLDEPGVAYLEVDGEVEAIAQQVGWSIVKVGADVSSALAGSGTGAVGGVHAYIIDSGISAHADLGVVKFVNVAGGMKTDCNGHGTHVAGIVGARDNASGVVGVAPGIALTSIKVLGCDGTGFVSNVVKGIDWVTARRVKPAVANLSLAASASAALDDAVRRSVAQGVFYAVAAGNAGADACNTSPARAGAGVNNGILTVAATDSLDNEASWSNYGACVDVWAPGVSILSTALSGGLATMSGTSMAAPHGAGGAALYLSRNGLASPADVESAIRAAAVPTATLSKDGRQIRRIFVGGF